MKIITLLFIFVSISCFAQLEENLLLHYKFDGNAVDETRNQFHGIPSEVTYVEDRFGNENSAAYFNGIDSFIDLPNLPELKPQLPVSFSFWIRYDSDDFRDRAVFDTSFENDRSSGVFFNSQSATGKYGISFGDGSPVFNPGTRRTYNSNDTIVRDQWIFVITTVTASLDMTIYIDCKERGGVYSGSGGILQYSLTPGSIGRHDKDLNVPPNYFKGALDDFKYWDRALTQDEIYSMCDYLHTSQFSENKFTVSPNPAKDIIIIKTDSKLPFILNIYDSLGRLVLSNNSKNEINIRNLSNGLYFLKFISDNTIQTKKLIIKK